MEKVRISVGGSIFLTTKDTLSRYPGTRLAELDPSSEYYDQTNSEYYFDRDPSLFVCILNLYRTKELHVTQAFCGNAVRNELNFWKIPEDVISPCCWRTLHQVDQDRHIMQALDRSTQIVKDQDLGNCCQTLRYRVWKIMDYPSSSLAAKVTLIFCWC